MQTRRPDPTHSPLQHLHALSRISGLCIIAIAIGISSACGISGSKSQSFSDPNCENTIPRPSGQPAIESNRETTTPETSSDSVPQGDNAPGENEPALTLALTDEAEVGSEEPTDPTPSPTPSPTPTPRPFGEQLRAAMSNCSEACAEEPEEGFSFDPETKKSEVEELERELEAETKQGVNPCIPTASPIKIKGDATEGNGLPGRKSENTGLITPHDSIPTSTAPSTTTERIEQLKRKKEELLGGEGDSPDDSEEKGDSPDDPNKSTTPTTTIPNLQGLGCDGLTSEGSRLGSDDCDNVTRTGNRDF